MPIQQTFLANKWGVTKQYVHSLVKKGLDLESEESADVWLILNDCVPKGYTIPLELQSKTISRKARSKAELSDESSEKNLQGLRKRLRSTEATAHALLVAALEEGRACDVARLVVAHEKAAVALIRVESDILDVEQKLGILVNAQSVKNLINKTLGVLATTLKEMPRMLASRVNVHDSKAAREELQRWVDALLNKMKNLESDE